MIVHIFNDFLRQPADRQLACSPAASRLLPSLPQLSVCMFMEPRRRMVQREPSEYMTRRVPTGSGERGASRCAGCCSKHGQVPKSNSCSPSSAGDSLEPKTFTRAGVPQMFWAGTGQPNL